MQSELRAVTQHAGATERQLETEHSSTWNKLRVAQRDRDEFQVKVVSSAFIAVVVFPLNGWGGGGGQLK